MSKHTDNNSAEWYTGEACVEPDCDNPAGTAWSPYWCAACNAERLDRIIRQLDEIIRRRCGSGE